MILIGIISCEKEKPKTTYSFKNNSSQTLYGLTTYYLDGTTRVNQIEHGTMWIGTETEQIETDNPQINFSFSYDPDGIKYENADPNYVKGETHNRFIFDNNTDINGGSTYYILASVGVSFNNLTSYYWNGTEKLDLVQHGNLPNGCRTRHVRTDRNAITLSWDGSYPGGSPITFTITGDLINLLTIESDFQTK